ncbi:uncharacterized protein TNIN_30831 [Trichonephila inaurata madagascariensis]|uniref:Uncharacterized protein n=1 Tax=Trichonephila inaurata madagascariensis TaxID=2747483 RepID=A0A8X6Y0H2_9ARAC|nr:uncharacterized protein TNIN_30831 [Trichonephila inaurata madagascariensis]
MISYVDMDLTPTISELSSRSRSTTSSRCETSQPAEPISDCQRRREAIIRLERQNVLIDGYQKFLIQAMNEKTDAKLCIDVGKHLGETKAARDILVSELRTMLPCLDVNCPDHTTLVPKNNDSNNDIEMINSNNKDKKPPQKRKNSKINSDDFVFPSKTARPITPTPVLQPVETKNSFDNLEQDPEILQNEKRLKSPFPNPRRLFF